jgi:exodeoxyribonuclease V beta subunit
MIETEWSESAALPEKQAWLLQASAGTGKTFQIAGLVVRLVAEYGIPIERILAITFTNAATAELRDRIRNRLLSALRQLRGEPQRGPADPFVGVLLSLTTPSRDELVQRLEIALRDFDLAAISTIHGFSQRMLTEFAFDSGEDPDLDLLNDPVDILEQLVDDELARFFHSASVVEVKLYQRAGLVRHDLLRVARAMCAAVEPAVQPARGPHAAALTRARVQEFTPQLLELQSLFCGDVGRAALRRLADWKDAFDQGRYLAGRIIEIGEWLSNGAPPIGNTGDDVTRRRAIDALRAPNLRAAFELKQSRATTAKKKKKATTIADDDATADVPPPPADVDALAQAPFWPALVALDAFVDRAAAFWQDFAPLADFAVDVRSRFSAEVRRRGVLTFDGILSRLAERVRQEGGAYSPLAARIRERFDVALVDEFQDTDAAQWTVIAAAFLGHRRLFLIGDPKQAIYSFRGADVHVYAQAANVVGTDGRRTMRRNFRSDPAVLTAMNSLWRAGSNAFDEAAFDYVDVEPGQRQAGATTTTPGLHVRWVDNRVFGGSPGEAIATKKHAALARMAADEIVTQLSATSTQESTAADGGLDPLAAQSRRPSDFAVLVSDHRQAGYVADALRAARVPAVTVSRASVFSTPVATWLAAWLDAVATGGRDREARVAVVTPLFGWTADDLAWALAFADRGEDARDEALRLGRPPDVRGHFHAWELWTARLNAAARNWPKWGFARVFDGESTANGIVPRLLSLPDGERHATDLRHLFELLHARERATRAGPAALAAWLRSEADVADDERLQRLESDLDAVHIETVHASKGLEYPYVLLPYVGDARGDKAVSGPVVLRGGDGARVDLSPPKTAPRDDALARARTEARREDLRKLYVALTRAKHSTVAWFGPVGEDGSKPANTALGRLLLRPADAKGHDDAALPVFGRADDDGAKAWTTAQQRLDDLAHRSGDAFAWSAVEELPAWTSWQSSLTAAPAFAAAEWDVTRESLQGRWRVTSYSGLAARSGVTGPTTATTHKGAGGDSAAGPLAAADVTAPVEADATAGGLLVEAASVATGDDEKPVEPALAQAPAFVPMDSCERLKLGRGTEYGTFVHGVFEELDFETMAAKDGAPLERLVRPDGSPENFFSLGGVRRVCEEPVNPRLAAVARRW